MRAKEGFVYYFICIYLCLYILNNDLCHYVCYFYTYFLIFVLNLLQGQFILIRSGTEHTNLALLETDSFLSRIVISHRLMRSVLIRCMTYDLICVTLSLRK